MEPKDFRRKRMSLGLTQVELAEMLDIKSNTISRYETGLLVIPKAIELALEAIEQRINRKDADRED